MGQIVSELHECRLHFDRLGHLDAKVQIPLNPGAKPISLPPFPSSPAKREVIDKQMDKVDSTRRNRTF